MNISRKRAFDKLQEVGSQKPYHGFTKLSLGYHKIICFRIVENKFKKKEKKNNGMINNNRSLLVELQDEVVFLPQYFLNTLNEEDIAELSSTVGETMYLYFGGRREHNQ